MGKYWLYPGAGAACQGEMNMNRVGVKLLRFWQAEPGGLVVISNVLMDSKNRQACFDKVNALARAGKGKIMDSAVSGILELYLPVKKRRWRSVSPGMSCHLAMFRNLEKIQNRPPDTLRK